MEKMMTKIIEVAVGLLLVAILVPLGLIQLAGSSANMTAAGVDPTVAIVLLVLLPVLAIIGLALYFIPKWKG
jgi:fumarate reductase subunit D